MTSSNTGKQDHFDVKHYIEPVSGKEVRTYTYKRKPCVRVVLTSRLASQYAGYALMEKDLRSVLVWLKEIRTRFDEIPISEDHNFGLGEDREKFNLIKGLFVAALTFYGKCFSKCEGRPVKLERQQLDSRLHDLHDQCIRYRHNFAAHSGDQRLEFVDVALVFPEKRRNPMPYKIFKELHQPDLFWPRPPDISISELVEVVRGIVQKKLDLLHTRIKEVEINPNAA